MKTICEMIDVMQAAANGKPIEARRAELPGGSSVWIQVANPSWNWKLYDYRVKPADPPHDELEPRR